MERGNFLDDVVADLVESILSAVCSDELDTICRSGETSSASLERHWRSDRSLDTISHLESGARDNSNVNSDLDEIDLEGIESDSLTLCHSLSPHNRTSYEDCDVIIQALLDSLSDTPGDNGASVNSQMKADDGNLTDSFEKLYTGTANVDTCSASFHEFNAQGAKHCDVTQTKSQQSDCMDNGYFTGGVTTSPERNIKGENWNKQKPTKSKQSLNGGATHNDQPTAARQQGIATIAKNSKTHPVLHIMDIMQCSPSKDHLSPQCSDDFADLRLAPTGLTEDDVTENYVPLGWMDTLTRRKQRNSSTSSRFDARRDNFVYCGPERATDDYEDIKMEASSCSSCLKLRTPDRANNISGELLFSGVASTPGISDKYGNEVLVVLADDVLWQKCNVGAIGLARLLLYLTSRLEKILLLLDFRNSGQNSSKNILETLSIFQNNSHIEITQILLLANDDPSLQFFLKTLFETECNSVESIEKLTEYIDELPLSMGGSYFFSQAEWANNRVVVDSFVGFCENVRHNFAREALAMTSHSLPSSARETRAMLGNHHKEMTELLDDRQVANLRDRAQRILHQLAQDETNDALSCADLVQSGYRAANEAVTRFVKIADDRLLALEQHLLVKQFEQSCDYISHWSMKCERAIDERFGEVGRSLEELARQRTDFDDFYINAMTEYAKCDCLLSEISQLNNLGYLKEEELLQKASLTQQSFDHVTSMVERKKEEIESVTCMFKFIDRAYSWALEGMKFVTMLDMDDCLNFDSCQLLIDKFDLYMKEHPAICDEDFDEILELARRYGNAKCMKQCEFARQKCAETVQLFNKRRDLIAKAKQQTKASSKKRMTSFRMKNRERLDKMTSSKSPEPSFTSSVFDGSVTSSDGRSSVGDVSLISTDWSPMEDMSHQFLTSSSSNVTDHCDVSVNSAHNPKPARKLLKKSSSMPGHQMTRHMHSQTHSHSGVTIGSPMRDDDVDSGKSKISLAIEELISTEKEYVRSLNYVIENYFPEMCRLDIPQALRCKRNVIFGNIEKISQFHSAYFLRDLEKCDGNPAQVAKTFQMHKDSFGLYALYSKNKPLSDQLLNEHGNQFFKKKQLELGDKMDLASYLLKPVQRMAKYALLLHAMAKRSSGTEERSLKEAEELVKFQLRHGNDLLTMDSIRDCDVNLKEQGNLLRQEQFVIYSGRRKMIRRVFLFEDLILFSKPLKVNGAHDIYQYKCSYKTAEIGMTENIGEDGFKFEIWFRRRRSGTNQDRFVLQSSSRAVKRSWVEEIRGLLWKQALRNRDHRKLEMSSMGVGSKPHLDLAPSNKNRITDRSVTTPPLLLSDRLASSRTRASIAVCSFDHGALQSKRPHSTISTSSSTSSVGSGNNASIISSLTLASWPTKVDSRSFSGYSPPMAYCDFHAIEEDKDEGCEESTSQSSISTLLDDVVEVDEKPNSRQYVTTPNPHLLVK